MRFNPLTRYLTYQLYHAGILLGDVARGGKAESVHEFRVALRKVRSLAKLYLKPSTPFPEDLKSAVKATNPIRELDVLIASLDPGDYPKTVRLLKQMRKGLFENLFSDSFSKKTRKALLGYYHLLCGSNPDISPEDLIANVLRPFGASLATFRRIDDKTSQKELHALRVDFKNARYGFEFLRDEGIKDKAAAIGTCKKLQNTLGAVQDGYNQIEWLKKLCKRHPNGETEKLLESRKKELKRLKAASRSALSHAAEDTRLSG